MRVFAAAPEPSTRVRRRRLRARVQGVRTLILPAANRRDFDDLHADVKAGCEVHFVESYQQVFDLVFDGERVAAAAASRAQQAAG